MLLNDKATMLRTIFRDWFPTDILFSIFALTLAFSYAIFFVAPYSGLYFNPTNGQVIETYVQGDSAPILEVGDVLEQVGPVSWDSYYMQGNQVLFANTKKGQTIDLVVRRNGQKLTIPWVIPGFNRGEFLARLFNVWWLAYIFWFFGMITQFFMRPKDVCWRLLIAVNYLIGLWLIAGSLSAWHLWGSSLLLHATSWLILPVFLNLHWLFPKPLGRISNLVWDVLYFASGSVAVGELLQVLPRTFYALAFLLILVGSIALLIAHSIWQPNQRREVSLLVIAILVALAPSIILALLGMAGDVPQIGPITLLALPIMPVAYFYAIYRRQLGGLELRANRVISLYAFLILLGTLLLLLVVPLAPLAASPGGRIMLTMGVAGLAALASIWAFPHFQALVERRLLGIELPYKSLPETYSARITTSTSLAGLQRLLKEEILPSLLVRQFAFLRLDQDSLQPLLVLGLPQSWIPGNEQTTSLITIAGKYLPPSRSGGDQALLWVRLVLPLRLDDKLIGFWLFGRRDPDDVYAQAEIPVLQSLADQTAIALSNITQTERLKTIYQADINRYEQERLRLAHDLHDSVLNQMAAMLMKLEAPLSPGFQQAYDGLAQRLREIVSDLRPPMLNYGLKPALQELADSLAERSQDAAIILVEVQADESRYAPNIEQHVYRIVQQACENALRHARAGHIRISGQLEPQKIDLCIEDDGVGFKEEGHLELDDLLASKHFGLAGMVERAGLINAEIKVYSMPGQGVQIRIGWTS
jgi:signal transduction histidine kinase